MRAAFPSCAVREDGHPAAESGRIRNGLCAVSAAKSARLCRRDVAAADGSNLRIVLRVSTPGQLLVIAIFFLDVTTILFYGEEET
jgi:hypothetical protein